MACQKTPSAIVPVTNSCMNFTVVDSLTPFDDGIFGYYDGFNDLKDVFIFNSDNKLQQHVSYSVITGSPVLADNDSFAWSNGNMVKSYYSFDSSSAHPYTTSEYDYNGHTLVASRYYLGTLLLVHSTYTTDANGRITSFTQFSDNGTYQYTPTSTCNLQYDSAGNLVQVTDAYGNLEHLYSGYDKHPNPWYGLPFDFAYNVLQYDPQVLSKNNIGLYCDFTYYPRIDSTLYSYSAIPGTNDRSAFLTNIPLHGGNGPTGQGRGHYLTVTHQCK